MGFISSSSPAPKRRTEPPHPRPDASSSSERPASIASQQLPRKDVQSRHTTRNGPDQTVPIRTKFPKASAEAIGQKTTSSTATSKSKSNRTEGEGGRRPQQLSHGTRSSATPRQHSDQGSATGGPPGLGGLSVHSSVSTSGGQGTHKGKGSAWLKGIRQFPAKWGFGRPPSLTLMTRTDTTLLQLLSCRELERMPPHTTQQNQRVNPASVTKSVDYKPEDVEGNCKHWPDFTFERMVDDFPILYNTVLMPDELGIDRFSCRDKVELTLTGPESPGFWVSNESQLHSSLDSHLLRYMRQYLRITFGTFRQQLSARGAEEVTIRNGGFTRNIKRKIPDIGVYSLQERGMVDSPSQFHVQMRILTH